MLNAPNSNIECIVFFFNLKKIIEVANAKSPSVIRLGIEYKLHGYITHQMMLQKTILLAQ